MQTKVRTRSERWLRRLSIAIVVLLCVVGAVKYFAFPTYTHRYRLSVEVEIDGQTKVGSGVVTVIVQDNGALKGFDNGLRFHTSAVGHAPIVDLGEKGLLIAVLDPNNFYGRYKPRPLYARDISFAAFFGLHGAESEADLQNRIASISRQQGRRTLPEDAYPGFVWIRDPKNDETADAVMPSDLAKTIDPTLRIKAVGVEITHDDNSNEIFEKLPWLEEMREQEMKHGTMGKVGIYSANARQFLGDEF